MSADSQLVRSLDTLLVPVTKPKVLLVNRDILSETVVEGFLVEDSMLCALAMEPLLNDVSVQQPKAVVDVLYRRVEGVNEISYSILPGKDQLFAVTVEVAVVITAIFQAGKLSLVLSILSKEDCFHSEDNLLEHSIDYVKIFTEPTEKLISMDHFKQDCSVKEVKQSCVSEKYFHENILHHMVFFRFLLF